MRNAHESSFGAMVQGGQGVWAALSHDLRRFEARCSTVVHDTSHHSIPFDELGSMSSILARELQMGVEEPCLLIDFACAVHNSSDSIRATPVVAMESFQVIDRTVQLFAKAAGQITHQFIMVSVDLRTDHPEWQNWTYLRIDFDDQPFPNGRPLVALSDDHEGLRGYSEGLGRIARLDQPVENGPSLDDIASLFEIVHSRTLGGYTCFSRMWLTENILLSTALKYLHHWLAGYVRLEALRRYAECEIDVVACVTGMLFREPAIKASAGPALMALRGVPALFAHSHPNNIEVHDEDIRVILEEWRPSVQAGFI